MHFLCYCSNLQENQVKILIKMKAIVKLYCGFRSETHFWHSILVFHSTSTISSTTHAFPGPASQQVDRFLNSPSLFLQPTPSSSSPLSWLRQFENVCQNSQVPSSSQSSQMTFSGQPALPWKNSCPRKVPLECLFRHSQACFVLYAWPREKLDAKLGNNQLSYKKLYCANEFRSTLCVTCWYLWTCGLWEKEFLAAFKIKFLV